VNNGVVEGQELNVLPRTVQLTMLCEQVHYRDGGVSFLQSTFQVTLYCIPQTYQNCQIKISINCLTFRSEFIMHNASMIKKKQQAALLSLVSTPVVLSCGKAKQVSSSVRTIV
jgi:hypothetical protein